MKEADAQEPTLTLTIDFLAIQKGKQLKLNNLTGVKGTWSVGDSAYATVSDSGVLKAKKTTKTPVTLTFTVGKAVDKHAKFMGKSLQEGDSIDILLHIVGNGKAVTKVSLKAATTVVAPGEYVSITATISPKKATYREVFWISADPTIATVNAQGVVTGLAPGTTTITATATSGVSKSVEITVSDKVAKLALNKTKLTLKKGKTYQLTVKSWPPTSLQIPAVVWASSKTSVATVDPTGLVTALKKGKTTITATDPISGLSAKCKITVK